jgi:hypothetical protein
VKIHHREVQKAAALAFLSLSVRRAGSACYAMGWAADITILHPDKVGSLMPTVDHDLPTGARRLKQKSQGLRVTTDRSRICGGGSIMRESLPCFARWEADHEIRRGNLPDGLRDSCR